MKLFIKTAIITCMSVMAITPTIKPANASINQTKTVAQLGCSAAGFIVVNPQYSGQTHSGLDVWICIETGFSRQAFTMINPGPYPVLACNLVECSVINMAY